jgi:hypothetical protein
MKTFFAGTWGDREKGPIQEGWNPAGTRFFIIQFQKFWHWAQTTVSRLSG